MAGEDRNQWATIGPASVDPESHTIYARARSSSHADRHRPRAALSCSPRCAQTGGRTAPDSESGQLQAIPARIAAPDDGGDRFGLRRESHDRFGDIPMLPGRTLRPASPGGGRRVLHKHSGHSARQCWGRHPPVASARRSRSRADRRVTRERPVGVSEPGETEPRRARERQRRADAQDPALSSSHASAALQDLDPGLDPGLLRWDLAHTQA
jgi:hypothetical protein